MSSLHSFDKASPVADPANSVTDVSVSHHDMANAIRALAIDAVERARSGHPGMPMGMADVATVLFTKFLEVDPAVPDWPDRDRFVLSAGHGSMLQYALHYLLGYEDMGIEEIKNFRQLGSRTAGHPEHGHALGIETTTGPLGQGLATAVGMAIAERLMNARYGDDIVDHRTFVIAGDGCLMEGVSHEAIDLAGHLRLGRLIVLWDDNSISIDGATSLSTTMDQLKRFEAARWHVAAIDGHDPAAVEHAIAQALAVGDRPSMIACKTVIGYGAPTRAGTAKAHGEPLGAQEAAGAFAALGWPHQPFEIPADILGAWRATAGRGALARRAWNERVAASSARAAFETQVAASLPADLARHLDACKASFSTTAPTIATRKASETVLAVVNAATQLTIGGSADLTQSNLTITPGMAPITAASFAGRYIHYGVREHGMSAAMNGLALHGGFIPYGGTFLAFTDYARGAIRLSALMGQRVIYVMTHDSIGLGEDGPTHQPIEHLAMLRATPNLQVFRPADAVETAECWLAALESRSTPSILVLSRQAVPTRRLTHTEENLSARGGYVLRETDRDRDVTLIATGSEIDVAMRAADILECDGLAVAVVSMPCWERFEAQTESARAVILGEAPRVAIEAAARLGWDRWIGEGGIFIGMTSFGASAPAAQLFDHFGITAERVAEAARSLVRPGESSRLRPERITNEDR
jgi:transketolase